MELNGDLFIGAPCQQVWQALNDPQVLVRCIPGGEEVRQVSATETHVRVLVKLGPVRARFVGKMLMSDMRPDAGCVLDFEGSGGAAGFAKGRSTVSLSPEGGGTRLRYSAQATVGGKLGQIGGRLIDASARQTADQFFAALGQQFNSAQAPAPTPSLAQPLPLAPAAPAIATRPGASTAPAAGEGVRVLWFTLGALATAFGFWLARALMH